MAILFNALAPVLSHANTGTAATQAEICTAMGVTMVAIPGDKSYPGQLAKGMNHCAYCTTHAGSFGLPPRPVTLFAVLGGHDVYPSLFFQSPSPLPGASRKHARRLPPPDFSALFLTFACATGTPVPCSCAAPSPAMYFWKTI